jgi:hypothetical protein
VIIIYLNITIRLFYMIMSYKRETTTILAVAIMAAAMVGAMMTEGVVGMQYANAKLLAQHVCKKTGEPGNCGHGKVPVRRERA